MPESSLSLADATRHLAVSFAPLPDDALASSVWAWGDYEEVRYAFLHSTLALTQLAVQIEAARAAAGHPPTQAQRILAQFEVAWRGFEARLVAVDEATALKLPTPRDWSIRQVVAHTYQTEGAFWAVLSDAARAARAGEAPVKVKRDAFAEVIGEPVSLDPELNLEAALARSADRHARVVETFAGLEDRFLESPAIFWEPEPLPIRFRLHRFALHLDEHANQLDKTLDAIGHPPNEAARLTYQLYRALGQVEGALVGAPHTLVAAREELAQRIASVADEVIAALDRSKELVGAITGGDAAKAVGLLKADKRLANARGDQALSVAMLALYHGQKDVLEAILAAGPEDLHFWDVAALGKDDDVKEWLDYAPKMMDSPSTDGFTALQLASFFGRLPTVQLLLERGANPHLASENTMGVQAIHSAAAGRHFEVLQALVEAGADVNARQEGGFRPLDAALQNGDTAMADYLQAHGAEAGE